MKRLVILSVSFLLAGCAEQALLQPATVAPGQADRAARQVPPITTAGLLDDMTDLDRLTRLPEPAVPHAAVLQLRPRLQDAGRSQAWFANGDCGPVPAHRGEGSAAKNTS